MDSTLFLTDSVSIIEIDGVKMAKKKITEWFDELDHALDFREQFAMERSWNKLELNFLNLPEGDTVIGPNLIYAEGDTLLSGLSVPEPHFMVRAMDAVSAPNAPVVEQLANSLLDARNLDLKQHVDGALLNAYLYCRAILKIGYDSEFGWNPRWDTGSVQHPFGLSMTQYNKAGKRIEFGDSRPGMPWVAPVAPHDFLVPWGTGPNVDDAPWVAHRFIRETRFLKDDPKYKNTGRLEPQMTMKDFVDSYTSGPKAYRKSINKTVSRRGGLDHRLYNECWEIHDKESGQILVLCYTHDKFLREEPDYLAMVMGGHPFVAETFIKHPRYFWSTPLAYYLGQHQKDQFDLSLQAAKQRRINILKFLMMGEALSDDEKAKITSGDVGAVAQIKATSGKKLTDVFMPFPKGTNIDLLAESEAIRRNSREAIGFSRNQAGEFDTSSRRTAFETAVVREGSQTRGTKKEDATKRLYTETIRKVILTLAAYWRRPRDVLIGQNWIKFNGDKLIGRYSYGADLVNRSPMSPAQRKMEMFQMMGYLSQFPNINLQTAMQLVMDSINDPAFEGFFMMPQQTALPSSSGMAPAAGANSGSPVIGAGAGSRG
jgi:hypothetical protein